MREISGGNVLVWYKYVEDDICLQSGLERLRQKAGLNKHDPEQAFCRHVLTASGIVCMIHRTSEHHGRTHERARLFARTGSG